MITTTMTTTKSSKELKSTTKFSMERGKKEKLLVTFIFLKQNKNNNNNDNNKHHSHRSPALPTTSTCYVCYHSAAPIPYHKGDNSGQQNQRPPLDLAAVPKTGRTGFLVHRPWAVELLDNPDGPGVARHKLPSLGDSDLKGTKKMDPKFNPETAKVYHFRYMREYRAVAVLWALLTIIWCILNVVAFVQPQWIGDTEDSPGFGHLGVYEYCYPDNARRRYVCSGDFTDFDKILNGKFKAATFFCGVSALLMLICVAALLLFFCFKKTVVFVFCGIIEVICAIFMFLACIIFPSGWDHPEVKRICGDGAGEFDLGECDIRWAYILAILGIFDAAILAVLAFFLAAKRAKIEIYSTAGTVTKSELNGFSETVSKKSMPIQPQVVAVPADGDPERYSEYSRRSDNARSRGGFQL
ncbi:hypothetical protein PoB_007094600 [Plakobranchus ocellatus]|uniref:MARVEL domain-containing protein n=1 Tax=Plakobranchus ocellatus TaxID=259542 RepID=A0AAV4DKE5_9GAST|nr:hypothetical protein PoB_007094600 [Plakobranchus ocellatus]